MANMSEASKSMASMFRFQMDQLHVYHKKPSNYDITHFTGNKHMDYFNHIHQGALSAILYILYPPQYLQIKEEIIQELIQPNKKSVTHRSFEASGGFTECCPGIYPVSPLTTCCQDIDIMHQFQAKDFKYDHFELEFDDNLKTYAKLFGIYDVCKRKRLLTQPMKDWVQRYWRQQLNCKDSQMNVHGPAVELDLLSSIDTTHNDHSFIQHFIGSKMDQLVALRVETDEVKRILLKWHQRKRKGNWPSVVDLMTVINCPCFVVPVSSTIDENHWRISFSMAEKMLIKNSKYEVKMVYTTAKMLMKQQTSIPTYYLKTALFWMLEDVPQVNWCPTNLFNLVSLILNKLLMSLCKGWLSHYFITEHNLLFEKEPFMIRRYCKQLSPFRRNILIWFNTCILKSYFSQNDLHFLLCTNITIKPKEECTEKLLHLTSLMDKAALGVTEASLLSLCNKINTVIHYDKKNYSASLYDTLNYITAVLYEQWKLTSTKNLSVSMGQITLYMIDILRHVLSNTISLECLTSESFLADIGVTKLLESMIHTWIGKQPMIPWILSDILIYGHMKMDKLIHPDALSSFCDVEITRDMFSMENIKVTITEMGSNLRKVFNDYKDHPCVLYDAVNIALPNLIRYVYMTSHDKSHPLNIVSKCLSSETQISKEDMTTCINTLYHYALTYVNLMHNTILLQQKQLDDFTNILSDIESMKEKCDCKEFVLFETWKWELFFDGDVDCFEYVTVDTCTFIKVNVLQLIKSLEEKLYKNVSDMME